MVFLGPALDQREQRHDEEAGEQADQGQIGHDPEASGLLPELRESDAGFRREPGTGEIKIGAEYRHAECAERYQTDFHRALREFFAP